MKKTEIKQTIAFTARNIRLFFREKGAFVSALIAPLIMLMLYILFLHSVLSDAFTSSVPQGFTVTEKTLNGFVASYEVSSILTVVGFTVAFVANMIMVDDRLTGVRADITVAPAKKSVFVLGYYFATAAVTLIICYATMLVGFAYIAAMGWQMTAADVFAAILDVSLTVMFGTALSSIVCYFVKSRAAMSAVSTIVSSVYGFIVGAYYPISLFEKGIANTIMCFPWTYTTGLLRTHFMGGYENMFVADGIPREAAAAMLKGYDVPLSFFGSPVPIYAMYLVVCCAIVVAVAVFAAINLINRRRGQ